MKTAAVLRFGAIGDAVYTFPVLRALKAHGYRVEVHCPLAVAEVYQHNPHVDELHAYADKEVSVTVSKDALLIDLDWIIESRLLTKGPYGCQVHAIYTEDCVRCRLRKQDRDAVARVPYELAMLQAAGGTLANSPALKGLFRTSVEEREEAERVAEAEGWAGKFVVLWALSPLPFKQYPFWYEVSERFCSWHNDAVVYTMGSDECRPFEVEGRHPRIRAGHWRLRLSAAIVGHHANLVVGGETAMMVIAACFNTPKIVLLGQSRPDNLTEYWSDAHVVTPRVPCYPCHQLHAPTGTCPTQKIGVDVPPVGPDWPVCKSTIGQDYMLGLLEKQYRATRGSP